MKNAQNTAEFNTYGNFIAVEQAAKTLRYCGIKCTATQIERGWVVKLSKNALANAGASLSEVQAQLISLNEREGWLTEVIEA